jgi:hypothetical protein
MGRRGLAGLVIGPLMAAVLIGGAAQATPAAPGRAPHATPSVTITAEGFACQFSGGPISSPLFSSDDVDSIEPYSSAGKTLYADLEVCQGVGGPATTSHTEFGHRTCSDVDAKSVSTGSSDVATFADTEALDVCSIPDDDGHGSSNADNVPLNFVRQKFSCPVTLETGTSGAKLTKLTTSDSIQVDQTYKRYAGGVATAITTVCVGRLPTGTAATPTDVADQVACSEANPAGGTMSGAGVAATYADGQFSETCNVPARAPVGTPVVGKSVVGRAVTGTILVKVPGSNRFVKLRPGQSIPLGSLVDATHGRVQVTSATDKSGHTTSGVFYAGVFRITQQRSQGPEITVLTLAGPKPSGCSAATVATVARRHPRKRKRSLWGNSKGDFRTTGTYASATERGTKWLTQDTCAGTLIHVAQGEITVDDLPHHRTFLLKAPHSYLAHPGKGG